MKIGWKSDGKSFILHPALFSTVVSLREKLPNNSTDRLKLQIWMPTAHCTAWQIQQLKIDSISELVRSLLLCICTLSSLRFNFPTFYKPADSIPLTQHSATHNRPMKILTKTFLSDKNVRELAGWHRQRKRARLSSNGSIRLKEDRSPQWGKGYILIRVCEIFDNIVAVFPSISQRQSII